VRLRLCQPMARRDVARPAPRSQRRNSTVPHIDAIDRRLRSSPDVRSLDVSARQPSFRALRTAQAARSNRRARRSAARGASGGVGRDGDLLLL